MPNRSQSKENKCPQQKSRRVITLQQKLDVLKRIDSGQSVVDVAKVCKLPRTTVQTIRLNAEKIRQCAKSVIPRNASKISRTRSNIMELMENLLSKWIEHQNQQSMPLSFSVICTKSKQIFRDLKEKGEHQDVTFNASRGWFDRFKKRANLHNINMTGEAASADYEEADRFPAKLSQIISEGEYSPKQVFNVDETGYIGKGCRSGHLYRRKRRSRLVLR